MSRYSPDSYCAIVAVDIADFTNPSRTRLHRIAMHDGLYEVLRLAFGEAGIQWGSCDVEDRGDGALILVPPQFPKSLIADRLSNRLLAGLTRYNAIHAPEAAIRLRVALHAGDVHRDTDGKVSSALDFAFRILEAQAAKTRLVDTAGLLAMIVSDSFYQEAFLEDPATGPSAFERIPVAVKRTRAEAWLRVFSNSASAATEISLPRVLPDSESTRLRTLLTGVVVPGLATLVTRAGGPAVPAVRHDATVWEAVEYLLDFNADADGLPPALTLVELLARQVGGALAENLMVWNDTQAHRLRLAPALARLRTAHFAPIAGSARLHLMILVDHDGLDPDQYIVSSWRQDDPDEWPPARDEDRSVAFAELEREVDRVVVGAEAAWAGYNGAVALEFVLPRSLLNLPVDRWCKEHDSGDPRPLSLDYSVVVRSLERMRSPHWHRVWRNRWDKLTDDPMNARMYFPEPGNANEPYRLDVDLQDLGYVSMLLTEAPAATASPGDELSAALRSGLPAVVWNRATVGADTLRGVVTRLLRSASLVELPSQVFSARQAAFINSAGPPFEPRIIHNLVVLWDDPRRLVFLDQSPARLTRGKIVDEREPTT